MSKSAIPVVFGAMTFGEGSRVTDIADCNKILDIFQAYGHNEIDTARVYNFGTSEEYLRKCDWVKRGLVMDTKLFPTINNNRDDPNAVTHKPDSLRKNLLASLDALGVKKVHMWYLHAPDHTTPFEETLAEVDKLHKEGYFDKFALSNFAAWEVAKVCELCIAHNWIRPTVYQGVYNLIHRAVEPELFPCLRAYDIGFYVYNPLAGGFFTGTGPKRIDDTVEQGSRFDSDRQQGKMYRKRYWKDEYFEALDIVRPVAEKHNLTLGEIALRWINHHSQLKKEHGDATIIGASSVKHIEENLKDFEKGPLPADVVEVIDQAWAKVKPICEEYFR